MTNGLALKGSKTTPGKLLLVTLSLIWVGYLEANSQAATNATANIIKLTSVERSVNELIREQQSGAEPASASERLRNQRATIRGNPVSELEISRPQAAGQPHRLLVIYN